MNHDNIIFTKKEMEDSFTAGVNFARNMMECPSNTEYMTSIISKKIQEGTNMIQDFVYCSTCNAAFDLNKHGKHDKALSRFYCASCE